MNADGMNILKREVMGWQRKSREEVDHFSPVSPIINQKDYLSFRIVIRQ